MRSEKTQLKRLRGRWGGVAFQHGKVTLSIAHDDVKVLLYYRSLLPPLTKQILNIGQVFDLCLFNHIFSYAVCMDSTKSCRVDLAVEINGSVMKVVESTALYCTNPNILWHMPGHPLDDLKMRVAFLIQSQIESQDHDKRAKSSQIG